MARRGRPPKPEQERNSLRQLREIISATQAELSLIIDVPLDTIKSIEAGRRPLSEEVQKRVARMTGASWDRKKTWWAFRSVEAIWDLGEERWRISDKLVECTPDHIRAYRKMMEQEASTAPDHDRDSIKMRVDVLFDQIPDRYWMRLLGSLQKPLDDLEREFREKFKDRKRVAKVFQASTPFPGRPFTDPKTGQIQARRSYALDADGGELIKYRVRMAKRYAELTSQVEVRPDGSWALTL